MIYRDEGSQDAWIDAFYQCIIRGTLYIVLVVPVLSVFARQGLQGRYL